MWTVFSVYLICVLKFLNVNSQDEDYSYFETTTAGKLAEGEKKLSDSIRKALEHFKQPEPNGLPDVDIPDPYPVPDMTQSLGFGTNLVFTDTALYGLNKFRILYVKTEIEEMECRAAMIIDNLQTHGNYSLNMWFNSYPGAFTANISDVKATAVATLGVEQDGKLRAQNISIDISFQNIEVNFENAGFLANMISGVFSSMGTFLYDSMKPLLLRDAHVKMREEINKKLDEIVGDIEFPNTISPIDMILLYIRNKLRHMNMDPYMIDDYNTSASILKISTTNTWITGLSTVHRIGDINLNLENNTVVADISLGTQEIKGSTNWKIGVIGDFLSKTGSTSFSVKYIRGRLILAQPLDTRKKMTIEDLQIEVGNIQLGFDGAGTLDYILEFSANVLPNLLRYQIIAAIRNPIIWKLQQELNEINVDEMIIEKLPEIDQIQEVGFQLSALRALSIINQTYDEDEFFNF